MFQQSCLSWLIVRNLSQVSLVLNSLNDQCTKFTKNVSEAFHKLCLLVNKPSVQFATFIFPQYTLSASHILHKALFSNAIGNMQPQEHLKTMVYAKFGGQTNCITGNVKIAIEFRHQPRCMSIGTDSEHFTWNVDLDYGLAIKHAD